MPSRSTTFMLSFSNVLTEAIGTIYMRFIFTHKINNDVSGRKTGGTFRTYMKVTIICLHDGRRLRCCWNRLGWISDVVRFRHRRLIQDCRLISQQMAVKVLNFGHLQFLIKLNKEKQRWLPDQNVPEHGDIFSLL